MKFITIFFDSEKDTKEEVLKKLYPWAGDIEDDEYDDSPPPRRNNNNRDRYSNVPRSKRRPPPKKKVTKEWTDEFQLNKAVKNYHVTDYFDREINVNFGPWPVLELAGYCETNGVSPHALRILFPERDVKIE